MTFTNNYDNAVRVGFYNDVQMAAAHFAANVQASTTVPLVIPAPHPPDGYFVAVMSQHGNATLASAAEVSPNATVTFTGRVQAGNVFGSIEVT